MSAGEVLYISAHGNPQEVGGLSTTALATELLNRGLKTGTKIDLKACSTAIPSDSYVEELEREIRRLSANRVIVLIEGYTDTHVIREEGDSAAKDPAKNTVVEQSTYNKIISDHDAELLEAKNYIAKAEREGEPLEEIARKVAAITKELFQALYAFNETVVKSDADAKGTSSDTALRMNLNRYIAANLRSMDPLWGDDLVLRLIYEQERREWSKKPASYIA